ncbi:MAG: hypothetical protein KBF89_05045 [Acidimicrobiia bacterium]|nr:hypothetical protein [Acidimicrobiia bacterium]
MNIYQAIQKAQMIEKVTIILTVLAITYNGIVKTQDSSVITMTVGIAIVNYIVKTKEVLRI